MRLARLTQRKEFLAAAAHGRRFRSSALSVQVLDRSADDEAGLRLGLTASRKVGNAVKRNRIRRRLRAAAQLALADKATRPCDLVVVARPETLTASFETLVAELAVGFDRARSHKPGRHSASKDRRAAQPAPARQPT
jgi:ribonuclease P protein component